MIAMPVPGHIMGSMIGQKQEIAPKEKEQYKLRIMNRTKNDFIASKNPTVARSMLLPYLFDATLNFSSSPFVDYRQS
jgi:hypothetical protein